MASSLVKMDVKDRKILHYLSIDARMPDILLAKKVGLSRNAIAYRIERLKREGVIKFFTCTVNSCSLGYIPFTLLLKFNEDIYEHPEIVSYFKKHENTFWLTTLSGQWDIFVEMVCKHVFHLQEILSKIVGNFGAKLYSYELYFSFGTLRTQLLVEDFYEGIRVEKVPVRVMKFYGVTELDTLDRGIIQTLATDSTTQYLTIAQKLGTNINVVRSRIKKLMELGTLVKFYPEISYPIIGYTEYLCRIKLKTIDPTQLGAIQRYIKNHGQIMYAFYDPLHSALLFTCAFKTPMGIEHLCRAFRKSFLGIVETQDYFIITQQVIFTPFPKGITLG